MKGGRRDRDPSGDLCSSCRLAMANDSKHCPVKYMENESCHLFRLVVPRENIYIHKVISKLSKSHLQYVAFADSVY